MNSSQLGMKIGIVAMGLAVTALGADEPKVTGVKAAQRPFGDISPVATIEVGGRPDWMVLTEDAVWMQNGKSRVIHRINPQTNREVARIECPGEPDSGLAAGFGFIWVPLVGDKPGLIGINPRTNRIERTFPIAPADAEGGIATSEDSIWMTTDPHGPLLRINPDTGEIRQRIAVPPGSVNPIRVGPHIWVTSLEANVITCIDARSGEPLAQVPTGPKPRFSTTDGRFLWVLAQGDGSVTKIDLQTRRAVATIPLRVPGGGGEICTGAGAVWVTILDLPLTKVDAATDRVQAQWVGPGGDSARYGFDSIWLCDLRGGKLLRFKPAP